MRNLIEITVITLLIFTLDVNAQTNRRESRKSVAYKANYQRIAAGKNHTLEIRNGTLWAYGYNANRQLGNGNQANQNNPVQIGTDNNWISIAAGDNHSLGLKSDGTLWAWGKNDKGQLGDGTTSERKGRVQIGTDTKWIGIAAGSEHSLGLKSDGSIWAWGANGSGQLGDETKISKNAPVQISGNKYIGISAGEFHSFALRVDGTLWAWGSNSNGQLGNASTNNKPVKIGKDNNWVDVDAGGKHGMALKSDGTLWAWGYNEFGQLGDNSETDKNTPVQIGSETKWVGIATGYNHSLGLKSDGTLWAWGLNDKGQLGDESTNRQKKPVRVGTSDIWVSVFAGGSHSQGVQSFGYIYGWGENEKGELGNGELLNLNSPQPTGFALNLWLSISAGEHFSQGLKANGTIWSWGKNDRSQLGDNSITDRSLPVQTGKDEKWVSIAAGTNHSLGLQADGTLWAWGSNDYGQLGDGTQIERIIPVRIGTFNDWVSITAGGDHSVALRSDGSLYAWGKNNKGQLGNGLNTNRLNPGRAGDANNWVGIAAGNDHNLALKSDGTLWAWGLNDKGQLGDGTTNNQNGFVQVGSDNSWISISCGKYHSLALNANGTIYAWGSNQFGQLGVGKDIFTPKQVGSDSKWIGISAGDYHSLGLQSDGTLWGWGSNALGQLGDGTNDDRSNPLQIGSETRWISIAGGGLHSLALKSDRSGFCATGYNRYGQLGIRSTQNETAFRGYIDPFTLLAKTKINLDSNSYVIKRGVGVIDTLGSINVSNNSTVNDSSSFVRSTNIIVNTGASVIASEFSAATAKFPYFKDNPFSDTALDHKVNANATVTLTDSVYKNLMIGSNAMVTFTQPRIYVKDFSSATNVTLKFSHCSELRIGNKILIGANNQFNPDMKGLIIYSAGSVTIDKGSTANVSVYTLDKLSVSGLSSSRVFMKGLFLANEIESKYTSWNWNNFDVCESALVSVKRIVKNDIGFKVFPNPNEGRFRIELNSTINAPLHISITDYLGIEVYQTSKPFFSGSTSMEIDLNHVLSSCYILKVQMGDQTFYKKIMVVK